MRAPSERHRRLAPVARQAGVLAIALLWAGPVLAQRAQVPAAPAPAASAARSETLAEFLDSLADNVLNADRSQLYRTEGKKRIVSLRSGWSVTLDEQANGRLVNAAGGPGTAGPPGKSFAFARDTDEWHWRLYTLKDNTGRESGLSGSWNWAPLWQLRGETYQLRDDGNGVRRRDSEFGLRFGESAAWVEAIVRRASLDDPRDAALGKMKPSADFAGLRASWQPPDLPGLTLQATALRSLDAQTAPGDERLAQGRTEIGADYRIDPALLPGARVYWREALTLGLLASDGLDERTTYQRIVGGEISDGSEEGRVYLQWREHSLSDSRNALLVAGWSHVFEPAPRWRLNTLVEQAEPAQGPSAIRSTTLGLRASHSAHPHHTLSAETELVRSSLKDSAYGALKYTHRLTENTLAAWRVSVSDQHPHEPGTVPSIEYKASAGWAWRDPEHRRLYTLSRYTLIDRRFDGEPVPLPDASDRRAHILLAQVGNRWGDDGSREWSLRGSRRWDRDDAFDAGALRSTDLVIARATVPLYGRWSIGAHVATRRASFAPTETGLGAELAYRLSDKAALAIGLNLRGIDDDELELDDRLRKGFVIRLRFSVDAAAARWLDPPMDAVRAARGDAPWP